MGPYIAAQEPSSVFGGYQTASCCPVTCPSAPSYCSFDLGDGLRTPSTPEQFQLYSFVHLEYTKACHRGEIPPGWRIGFLVGGVIAVAFGSRVIPITEDSLFPIQHFPHMSEEVTDVPSEDDYPHSQTTRTATKPRRKLPPREEEGEFIYANSPSLVTESQPQPPRPPRLRKARTFTIGRRNSSKWEVTQQRLEIPAGGAAILGDRGVAKYHTVKGVSIQVCCSSNQDDPNPTNGSDANF